MVIDPVAPGTKLNFSVEFDAVDHVADATFAFRLHRSTDQLLVYDGHFSHRELGMDAVVPGRFTVQYQFDVNLTRGQYYFDVFAQHTPTQRFMGRLRPAGHVTVAEARTWGGVADVAAHASVVRPGSARPAEPRNADAVTLC